MFDKNNQTASECNKYRFHTLNFLRNKIIWISLIISVAALIFSLLQYISTNQRNAAYGSEEAQARTISAWIKDDTEDYSDIGLNNLSSSPVYDIVVTVVSIGNSGSCAEDGSAVRKSNNTENGALLTILPPGKYKAKINAIGHGMSHVFGVEIAFRDFNNNSWIITADGHLRKINKPPLKYYNLPGPNYFSKLEDYN